LKEKNYILWKQCLRCVTIDAKRSIPGRAQREENFTVQEVHGLRTIILGPFGPSDLRRKWKFEKVRFWESPFSFWGPSKCFGEGATTAANSAGRETWKSDEFTFAYGDH
jgi:hypothetical protein